MKITPSAPPGSEADKPPETEPKPQSGAPADQGQQAPTNQPEAPSTPKSQPLAESTEPGQPQAPPQEQPEQPQGQPDGQPVQEVANAEVVPQIPYVPKHTGPLPMPPGEHDIVGGINEISSAVSGGIRASVSKLDRAFGTVFPAGSETVVSEWVGRILWIFDNLDKATRGIHEFSWLRQNINGFLYWVFHQDEVRQREAFMAHYVCWRERLAVPAWDAEKQKYPTLKAAMTKGVHTILQTHSDAWVHEHCIAGKCPLNAPIPAETDLNKFSTACCQIFSREVEAGASSILDMVAAPKKLPEAKHDGTDHRVKDLKEVLKEPGVKKKK